jgi:CheY-like chemotaxis protein
MVKEPKTRTMSTPKNILLIDDDEVFIFLTTKMLQSTGSVGNISVSYSAMEAIHFLEMTDEKQFPDIILLDLNMPGLSGWDFLDFYGILYPKFRKAPLLYVVSSSIADTDAERALKLPGVNGYIAKPINPDAVQMMLNRAA